MWIYIPIRNRYVYPFRAYPSYSSQHENRIKTDPNGSKSAIPVSGKRISTRDGNALHRRTTGSWHRRAAGNCPFATPISLSGESGRLGDGPGIPIPGPVNIHGPRERHADGASRPAAGPGHHRGAVRGGLRRSVPHPSKSRMTGSPWPASPAPGQYRSPPGADRSAPPLRKSAAVPVMSFGCFANQESCGVRTSCPSSGSSRQCGHWCGGPP